MLTTGGGWQDQVGGVLGGFKRCASAPSLPLRVTSQVLHPSDEALHAINAHLLLVYTGKTRLARNLLQDVLRRWYTADARIVDNVRSLKANAEDMEQAVLACDVPKMGACLDAYWSQKKKMCDAEPPVVTRILSKLRPHVYGASLCGAGGGGFLLLITRRRNARPQVETALRGEAVSVHDVAIHNEDLRTQIFEETFV